MAAGNQNLKFTVGADTSGFEAGARKVKQGIKDLEGVGNTAMTSIGDAFGISTGKVGQMSSAIVGLGSKLRDCGNTGAQAIGSLITSMGTLGAGIAGLGIAGAIAAFKDLSSEAENFKQTVAGANLELSTTAYVSTFKQIVHDLNSSTGQAIAEQESSLKRFWGTFGASRKIGAASGFNAYALDGMGINPAVEQMAADWDRVAQGAGRAAQLANENYELDLKIDDALTTASGLEDKIAALKLTIADSSKTTEERQTAINEATELIKQKYEGENGLAGLTQKLADNMKEANDIASSTPDQIKAANAQQRAANALKAQESAELRALTRYQNSLNNSLKKTKETESEIVKLLKEASALIDKQIFRDTSTNGVDISSPMSKFLSGDTGKLYDAFANPKAQVKMPVTLAPRVTEQTVKDTEKAVLDLTPVVADAFSTMGESIGSLIGDLATGGDAWKNFGNTAISSLGDMAIAVGQIAIKEGLAMEAIKVSLETLGGWGAVAAGTALVALGYAVKTGLSNVASGDYSASSSMSSVASTGYTGSSSMDRQMQITVSGTLSADGNKLVAVLNNENNRRSISS